MAPNDEPYYAMSAQRDPRCFDDRPGKLHMYVAPNEIQIGNTRDNKNRRLIHLLNVPLGYNYIAPQINDGDEFAIGGDNAHIVETLANHLKYRSDETWHIVAIPESHIRNFKLKPQASHAGNAGQSGSVQVSGFQANQQNPQGASNPAATAPNKKQKTQHQGELSRLESQLGILQIQPGFAQQIASGPIYQPYQQSQQAFGFPQRGNVGGFGLSSSQASWMPQGPQSGFPPQGNFGDFGQYDGQASSFAQAQQPGFPQQGNFSNFGQATLQYDAFAPGANVFDQSTYDWIFQDQGTVLDQPNNGNNNAIAGIVPENEFRLTPLLQPSMTDTELDPTTKVLRAHLNSPGRFVNKTGTGKCDWCGRFGHEAVDCLKWDPEHFDKAVCIACNNAAHSIDECPKFNQMEQETRAFLLLDKGTGRPGVRSKYHAWTDYCTRHYWGDGFPMTRRFARSLARDERIGPVVQNMWKVWDYSRGVPKEFLDYKLDSVRKIVLAGLDERFESERPFSVYGQDGALSGAEAGLEGRDEDGEEDDDQLSM